MAEKKKIMLDGDWNRRIERAISQGAKKKGTEKKKAVKRTKKRK